MGKERYALVYGSTLKVHEGQHVEAGQPLVEWDPFTSAMLTEVRGKVSSRTSFPAGQHRNVREETDKVTGLTQMVIARVVGDREAHPDHHHQVGQG